VECGLYGGRTPYVPRSDVSVAGDLEVETEHRLADEHVGVKGCRQVGGDVDERRQFDASWRADRRRSCIDVEHTDRTLTAQSCIDTTQPGRYSLDLHVRAGASIIRGGVGRAISHIFKSGGLTDWSF